MIQRTYKCDGCGVAKQQTNHWFCVEMSNGGEMLIAPWKEEVAQRSTHYCGAGCLGKAVSLWAAPKNVAAITSEPEVLIMVYPESCEQLDCGCWNQCEGHNDYPI